MKNLSDQNRVISPKVREEINKRKRARLLEKLATDKLVDQWITDNDPWRSKD